MSTWHNTLYDSANDYMAESWARWETDLLVESWGYTIPARLAYVCDAIVNLVILPFAIISVIFGTLHALITWDRSSEIFVTAKAFVSEKSNHFLLSACGSLFSPALAHKYRDANLTPYVIAFRIAVLSTILIYRSI